MIRKIFIMTIMLLSIFSLTACDTTDDPEKEVIINCYTHYVNVTEEWTICTNNGYKAIDVTKEYDKEKDIYTVKLTFAKPLKEVKKDG